MPRNYLYKEIGLNHFGDRVSHHLSLFGNPPEGAEERPEVLKSCLAEATPFAVAAGLQIWPVDPETGGPENPDGLKNQVTPEVMLANADNSPDALCAIVCGQRHMVLAVSGPSWSDRAQAADRFIKPQISTPLVATDDDKEYFLFNTWGALPSMVSNQHGGVRLEILSRGQLLLCGEKDLRWDRYTPTMVNMDLMPRISMADVEDIFRSFSEEYAVKYNMPLEALGTMESGEGEINL